MHDPWFVGCTQDPNAYDIDPVAQACEPLPALVADEWLHDNLTSSQPVVALIERGNCTFATKVGP